MQVHTEVLQLSFDFKLPKSLSDIFPVILPDRDWQVWSPGSHFWLFWNPFIFRLRLGGGGVTAADIWSATPTYVS